MESKHISKEKIRLKIIIIMYGQWNLLAWFCGVPLSLLHIVLQHVIFNFTLSFMVDQGVPLEHQKIRSPFNYATHLALYIVRCSILNQRSFCPIELCNTLYLKFANVVVIYLGLFCWWKINVKIVVRNIDFINFNQDIIRPQIKPYCDGDGIRQRLWAWWKDWQESLDMHWTI